VDAEIARLDGEFLRAAEFGQIDRNGTAWEPLATLQ